jgi:hypothetical protein
VSSLAHKYITTFLGILTVERTKYILSTERKKRLQKRCGEWKRIKQLLNLLHRIKTRFLW